VFSAILGPKAVEAVRRLKEEHGDNAVIISLITGNWIRLRRSDPRCPIPLVRGWGHKEFKQAVINNSDEIYVISPLGKIFCDVPVAEVNEALHFSPNATDPDREAYDDVDIGDDVACRTKLISTFRNSGRLLYAHSNWIEGSLGAVRESEFGTFLNKECVDIPHLMLPFEDLPGDRRDEIALEFPHSHTRNPQFRGRYFHVTNGQ
jgi:hypothetical protein